MIQVSAFNFNGLPAGDTPDRFTAFQVSPVRPVDETAGAEIEVCKPGEHRFWSIYGDAGKGWLVVHDDDSAGTVQALVALSRITDAPFSYRDACGHTPSGSLSDLTDTLTERIHEEIPGYDDVADFRSDDFDAHPLAELREGIVDCLEPQGLY